MSPAATKSREKARSGRAAPVVADLLTSSIPAKSTIVIDGVSYDLVNVQATGDIVLEVTFENTSSCNRSIPADIIKDLRLKKFEIPSSKVFYRVGLGTLKKQSKYFAHLLGSDVFKEGQEVKDAFSRLTLEDLKPSEVEAEKLPRVTIVNDDLGTKTLGREAVFLDLLHVLHGEQHVTKPVNLLYLTILVILADRYDCLPSVSRYMSTVFTKFKYPQIFPNKPDKDSNNMLDIKSAEEKLRQKCLIFYHTNQSQKFTEASKDLIMRGSIYWNSYEETKGLPAAWWDLPDGIEVELIQRRKCIIKAISSLQMHFVSLYAARGSRLCKLGYNSSESCDQFQLGEMVKFLTRKGLLNLLPFQAVSPDDPDFIWPQAYTSDIADLIADLRAWPEYQIDGNHRHCGARVRVIPSLKYVQDCIQQGAGIKINLWKTDRAAHTWILPESTPGNKEPFVVGGETLGEKTRVFDFPSTSSEAAIGSLDRFHTDEAAKVLFTARKWIWTPEKEEESTRLRPSGLAFKF